MSAFVYSRPENEDVTIVMVTQIRFVLRVGLGCGLGASHLARVSASFF